jgi:hypothetical protein
MPTRIEIARMAGVSPKPKNGTAFPAGNPPWEEDRLTRQARPEGEQSPKWHAFAPIGSF